MGIRSFVHCSFAQSLNCSGQMSKCEQFAQLAQDKWATVSKLLRSLMANERIWAICSGHSGQMSEWTNHSFFLANLSFSLSVTKNEQLIFYFFCKVVHFSEVFSKAKDSLIPSEWESESLKSLRTNERPCSICSGCSEGISDCEQITQVAHKKLATEQIAHFLSGKAQTLFEQMPKRAICSKIRWVNSKPWFWAHLINYNSKIGSLLLTVFAADTLVPKNEYNVFSVQI